MIAEIKIPEIGESITEGIIVEWLMSDGDYVQVDGEIFELETDKITMNITSKHAGQLSIKVQAGKTVNVGQVVATVDTDAAFVATEAASAESAGENAAIVEGHVEDTSTPINPPAGIAQVENKLKTPPDTTSLSPAVRRLISEKNLDPRFIPASGKGGRITKTDVLAFLGKEPEVTGMPEAMDAPEIVVQSASTSPVDPTERQTRIPMTRLRQRVAEHLVQAQQTAAILTTFNEVDMYNLMALRRRFGDAFKEKYGVKLGIMSFFVKAAVEALKEIPIVRAQIDGDQIVMNNFFDIGVAVSTEKGLIVPVVRDADKLSFAQIEEKIADYVARARDRSITLNDLSGGIFTISNGGIFGSLLSTPILNYPQSAILGMHTIKKRPVIVGDDDHIEVRPMMYLALSYDHRLIDGHEAVLFLRKIIECIEQPELMLFEI